MISIHAPRAGGDLFDGCTVYYQKHFNPRPPCGGRRAYAAGGRWPARFQSTPPVRGATIIPADQFDVQQVFQSTPPVRGATATPTPKIFFRVGFQSTPPVRGATYTDTELRAITVNFNPRPPCGGRRRTSAFSTQPSAISIHAPRAGGDFYCNTNWCKNMLFQSTPPVRGATASRHRGLTRPTHFNPRPPCGGRRSGQAATSCGTSFQSTPPVRGATVCWRESFCNNKNFNPRPPCGGRPATARSTPDQTWTFQSTPPVRGATPPDVNIKGPQGISIHAPRAGGDA